ncbi:MAG: hypothetical protein DWQ31_16970 [Planctomycetota bacterium]|nr:MAG: hypothetical protein DWQ31_16970 [Planctomycetota bacterium]REJ92047.1 MAG: hypothetical protein DWQ35_12920 [Planctomycetota bacterium]REK28583.1 MAG: hypothetical protein DWQ42_04510 [Planctomycetota bacterium]REK39198.1 MAG: hypothetical protein DWQ46_18095 [Planctomycetota bacterium]
MARIELRHATIRIKDGLAGTATINEATPAAGDTDLDIDTVVLNSDDTDLVPIGARFTIDGSTGGTVHTVTARTPAGAGPTTNIEFTPAIPTGDVPTMGDGITFLPQQIDVKVGDGNLTYTENKEYEYELDRGSLDTVREGDEVPMDVNLDFVYEFVTTGTGESITPVDAIKGKGGAAEWVSSSADPCEPFAVDIEVEHVPPCGGAQLERTIFPDFRPDTLEFDLDEATISATGRCNAIEPTVSREDQS